ASWAAAAEIRPALPSGGSGAPLEPGALTFGDGRIDAVRRDRQIIETQARGIGDGIGEGRQEGGKGTLARLLGPEWSVRVVTLHDPDGDWRGILDGGHAVIEHIGRHQ